MKSFGFVAMALFLFHGAYHYALQTDFVRQDFPEHIVCKGARLAYANRRFRVRRLWFLLRVSCCQMKFQNSPPPESPVGGSSPRERVQSVACRLADASLSP